MCIACPSSSRSCPFLARTVIERRDRPRVERPQPCRRTQALYGTARSPQHRRRDRAACATKWRQSQLAPIIWAPDHRGETIRPSVQICIRQATPRGPGRSAPAGVTRGKTVRRQCLFGISASTKFASRAGLVGAACPGDGTRDNGKGGVSVLWLTAPKNTWCHPDKTWRGLVEMFQSRTGMPGPTARNWLEDWRQFPRRAS